MRCHAELLKHQKQQVKPDEDLDPMAVMFSDGVPDHNVKHASVQAAIAAYFRGGDFDYVCFIRTCPGNSWRNPVERVMSILNIALSGVAVAREVIADDPDGLVEKMVRAANTLTKMRTLLSERPELEERVLQSCESIKRVIMDRFKQMSLKGVKFIEYEPVTRDEKEAFFEYLRSIDPTMEKTDTTSKDIAARPRFSHFMRTHAFANR